MIPSQISEIALSAEIDGIRIPARLTMPERPIGSVLLIPGSLNSDIDGNYAPMFPGQPPITTNVYRDLAHQLGSLEIAVLRFAKTGPGTGSEVVHTDLAAAKYKLFSQRLRVAGVFLSELQKNCPHMAPVIAGHSEGAVVASLLARADPTVRGVILLSGPARPLLHLMVSQQFESDQRHGRATPEREQHYQAALAALADFAASRPLPQDIAGNPYMAFLSFAGRPENAPYLRSLESVDPAAEFAGVLQPALIVQGGRDMSVFPGNAETLHRMKPDAKLVLFPELQHCYKKVPEGLSPQESFAVDSESDPAVAQAVASWMASLRRS